MNCAVFICCTNAVTRCHSLPFVVTLCHLLYYSLSLVVIRCHLLYISLSLVSIRCHSLYHSLSLVFTRCTTRLSFYKGSLQTMCPVEMSTFHQLKFKGSSLITLSWLDHVKWRSGTLLFWYVFSAGFVAVSQVMTWLHHVTCRNANVSFWYEFPPRLVIVAFVIFALWRV